MDSILTLSGEKPLAQGNKRFVFQHPHDPDLLVKVMQPWFVKRYWSAERKSRKVQRRYRQYVNYVREINEYISLCARFGTAPKCVQRAVGVIQTDLGLGFVARKVCDRDGSLAPSILKLVNQSGLTPDIVRRIGIFQEEALACDLVIGKLHDRNLVLGWDPEINDHRFVMIDGLGEKTFLPIHEISSTVNRLHTKSRIKILLKMAETLDAARAARLAAA